MSIYLSGNPLPWLLEEADPEIRYVTLRDICGGCGQSMLNAAYADLYTSMPVKNLFRGARNGVFGDASHFDLFYRGAMWCFAEAVEYGLDRREALVETTAEFLLLRCQSESGGFILNWKPARVAACRTGDMIRYLFRAGFDDERIHRGIDWIVRHQRHDGGWLHCPISGAFGMLNFMLLQRSGDCAARDADESVPSCPYASIACLMALLESASTHLRAGDAIRRAAEFFLANRMFCSGKSWRKGLPCVTGWRRGDMVRIGYPVLSQYDVLYGLVGIARAGYFNDARTGEAFNAVMSRQNPDGTWNMERAAQGMLVSGRRAVGKKNKWVTLNAMRLLRYARLLNDERFD